MWRQHAPTATTTQRLSRGYSIAFECDYTRNISERPSVPGQAPGEIQRMFRNDTTTYARSRSASSSHCAILSSLAAYLAQPRAVLFQR